jgi:hypothetical protein
MLIESQMKGKGASSSSVFTSVTALSGTQDPQLDYCALVAR